VGAAPDVADRGANDIVRQTKASIPDDLRVGFIALSLLVPSAPSCLLTVEAGSGGWRSRPRHHVTDAFAERGEVRATAEGLHRQRGYEIVIAAVYRSSLVRVPSGLSPVLFELSDHAG
jgi:hypothetical protein